MVDADGTLTEQPWSPDPDAPIDCFYVYPTISADTSEVSDRVPGEEERFVTLNQAARLGEPGRLGQAPGNGGRKQRHGFQP